MRNLEDLNLNEGGHKAHRKAPTRYQFLQTEQLIGAKLPSAYTDFLTFCNGGHPESDTFYIRIQGEISDWSVDKFFRLSLEPDDTGDLVWNYRHRWQGIPDGVVPIACDGGGNLICLDLRSVNDPKVVLWIHDSKDKQLFAVAASFEEFIDSLVANPDFI